MVYFVKLLISVVVIMIVSEIAGRAPRLRHSS